MRISGLVSILILVFMALSVGSAGATTIPFGDSSTYWPGWNNGSGDDSDESIGIPNFTGGTAVVVDCHLVTLTFDQPITSSGLWPVISPGDMFIYSNQNQTCDYALDDVRGEVSFLKTISSSAGWLSETELGWNK